MSSTRQRTNVIVIVLIVGVVFGLLIMGVNAVRGAASNMMCQTNCKRLGMPWHGYHDANGHVVPGTYPNPELPPDQRLSWGFTLEPFIESDAIFARTDKSKSWDFPANRPYTMIHHPIFVCPSVADPKTSIHTSYIGVAGIGPDAATLPKDDSRIGAFGYDRTLNLKEFTDGTSNTILLLETRSGGPWAQGGSGTVRGLDPNDRPHHGPGRFFDADHRGNDWLPRSSSTITITMCDGSQRTLKDSVAPEVLEALATVRGGDVVPGEW